MNKEKWQELDQYFDKKNTDYDKNSNDLLPIQNDVPGIDTSLPAKGEIVIPDTSVGFIATYRLNRIANNANEEKAKLIIESQLRTIKEAIVASEQLKREKIELLFEAKRKEIESEYAKMMNDLGLKNKNDLFITLKNLMLQTNKQMSEACCLDINKNLRDQLIQAILKSHEKFFDEITRELGLQIKEIGEKT